MKKIITLCLSLFAIFSVIACTDNGVCLPGETYAVKHQQALTARTLVGDAPNAQAYQTLSDRHAQHKPVSINVYRYEPGVTLDDEIAKRGLHSIRLGNKTHVLAKDEWEYAYDVHTAFLDAGHKDKLHAMMPVSADQLKDDSFYINTATDWALRNDLFVSSPHTDVRPYKLRKYHISSDDEQQTVIDNVSELALAFTEFVDGWPVMSAHKSTVHLSVDGEIIGYSKNNKRLGERAFELHNDDILTPDEAIAQLFADETLSKESVEIVRKEFGYFDFNKHNVRKYLAPYYVFVLKPAVGSKLMVRPVLAIKNSDIKKAILDDSQRDHARKSDLYDLLKGDLK